MPGNEVADKLHNFFEQDNVSQHQPQVASGNWPVLNNNLWVGSPRHNRTHPNSNLKNLNLQSSESERGNGWPSSRMPYGRDLSQLTLRPDFAKSQPRTQQLSFNGFMHSPQSFQTRPNQMEFLGEDKVLDQHNLTSKGLTIIESQQGNAPEHSQGSARNSEGLETAKSRVNFDFLGGQQPLMRSQQPGAPQPWPGQQSGFNDMQLWQQHFMYKQLQEHQRQQQLDQEARQSNSVGQLPTLVTGMPVHESSNYTWSGDVMGGDNKTPSTSQMFVVGNMNWVQRGGSPAVEGFPNGLMVSQDQSRTLRSMGSPQNLDQSLYGAPVATPRGSLNQYYQFQGIPHNGADMLTKAGGNQTENPVTQSAAFNSFQNDQSVVFPNQVSIQGNNLFSHIPVQTLNNGFISGNFSQLNPLPRNMPTQEFHGSQERPGWAASVQEKEVTQVGPSHGVVSLDPTEEKILFNDDGIWDASFGGTIGMGTIGSLRGNQLEGTDYLNVFPSIQSGSWSALMQSAVAEASSSDTGLQDEWSGLSFEKMDVSTKNHPTAGDRKQTTWVDDSLQAAPSLTSRPFPLFDDANMGPSRSIPVFQQSTAKFSFNQSERERTDPPHDALQQSPKETGKWLDQSSQQKPLIEGSLQIQTNAHLENTSPGAWGNQMYEQSRSAVHSDIVLNPQNMQGSWAHQQSMPLYNISNQSCNKLNGWNMNESLTPTGDDTLKICDNESDVQHMSDFSALPNSSNSKMSQEINQQVLNSHQLDYGKHANFDSSLKYRGNENVGNYQRQMGKGQVQESSMNNSERVSGETYDKKWENSFQKEISNDSYSSGHSHPGQHTGGSTREKALFGANDSRNQKSAGQGLSQPVTRGPKSQEQGYFGQSKFVGHSISNNVMDMEKSCVPDSKRNAKGAVDATSRGIYLGYDSTVSASFDGSDAFFAPKRTGQTSQNMLELLHKVDQSRDNTTPHIGTSDQNLLEITEGATSDASVAHLHHSYSSASHGFGLRLAPPSQRQSFSNPTLSSQTTSQTINDLNSRHVDPEIGDRGPTWLTTSTAQSLPRIHEDSQREYRDNKSNILGQTGNENLPSNVQGKHGKITSHFRQTHKLHDGVPADQSVHSSVSGASNRILPFNPGRHADSRLGIASTQSYSSETDRSQPMNVSFSNQRVSGQQKSILEPIPVSQPPITLGMSQQGAFSAMLHNVWTNISAQQRLSGGPPHKVPPNMFQSIGPSNSTSEATLWAPQTIDDHGMKNGGNGPTELGTCTINSQHLTYGEEQPRKDNSVQQLSSERVGLALRTDVAQGKEPVVQSAATSNQDIEAFGRSLKSSDILRQNYSLLHQMKAMKDPETDPSRKSGKRLKETEPGADAQQTVGMTGQRFVYGYSSMTRDPVDNELSGAARHFPSPDAKMLCFSLNGKDDPNANGSTVHIEDVPSQDIVTFERNDPRNHSSHNTIPSRPSTNINPQMAPSWFEHYGTYKNGQILAMYDGLDSSRSTAKVAAQKFFFGKASENLHIHSTVEQANIGDAVGSAWKTLNTVVANEYSSPQFIPPDAVDQNLAVVRLKKRKSVASELLPWHKEATQGSQRLQDISIAELDWAQAANRQIEKVEDESEVIDDVLPMPLPRRRLILTTQLMQQLLRSIPAAILCAEATSEYESVAYFAAKLALGDACNSLNSCSGSDSRVNPNNRNTTSEKFKASERVGDQLFLKELEDFIGRARKLENDLPRLDKRASILDLRVECQDLERFSIVNRFARFHNPRFHDRSTTASAEGSSSSEATARKTLAQRYVNALPMPRNLPEGVLCLSL
ncbi:uncharacterized protein LOC143846740 isoform X2 [Tasmannia lanceolata]|uniref:uncharacterized protein LOC143846740 isoform X2 n=1 Tax=Tasmannia lanceolata TaxID=3420 RepID=UPI0040643F9E